MPTDPSPPAGDPPSPETVPPETPEAASLGSASTGAPPSPSQEQRSLPVREPPPRGQAATLVSSVAVFASYAAWRVGGSQRAGERLIDTLGSVDEHLRTLAAMLLSRAGRRAQPLLVEAVERRHALSVVLVLLGDLENPELVARIAPLTADPDPQVARAARDALAAAETGGRGGDRRRGEGC